MRSLNRSSLLRNAASRRLSSVMSLETTTALADADDDDTVFAYQLGAGLGYEINPNLTISLDYRFFATVDPDFTSRAGIEFSTENMSHNGGVRLKRPDLRKLAIRRTSGCGKFAPRGEGGGAIELEIVTAVEMAFLVEVVVN